MAGLGDYDKKSKGNRGYKMSGPSLYRNSPLEKKGWLKRLFSKKEKAPEETSTEHFNRQVKEKDDYYAQQKKAHSLKRY